MDEKGEVCSSCVTCPFCAYDFQTFANAESFSMVRCPKCSHWFHVHIRMGLRPAIYLNPDEFQEEVEQMEGIFDEKAGVSELLDDEQKAASGKSAKKANGKAATAAKTSPTSTKPSKPSSKK